MKSFMLRVRLTQEQRHALIEKCQRTGKTMSELTIEGLNLPVSTKQDMEQKEVKMESNTNTAETEGSIQLPKSTEEYLVGKTCIEPGCEIFVDKPVLIHGMKAWYCSMHTP